MHSFPEFKQDEFSPYLQQSSSHNFTTGFGGTSTFMMYTSSRLPIKKLSYIIQWLFQDQLHMGK